MMKEEGGQRCRIALVGNPNVGKSVIFGFLSGRYATVSNYSGTTVEITTGETSWEGKKVTLIDTPGIQTLIPMSEEEKVTREILTGVDAVIQVGDAKNLGRTLFLSLQLAEIGIPFLLALNMEDESGALGISVDKKRLATLLGIPVVGTIAIHKKGLPEIRHQLLGLLSKNNGSGEAIRHEPPSRMIDQQRFQRVDALVGEVTRRDSPPRKNHREWIGRISTHPIWGVPVLGAVLLAIYEFVGKFGAQTMVGWLEEGLFGRLINPAAVQLFSKLFSFSPFLRDLLVGPYGVITMALTYAFAIIFPIVLTFFLFFSLTFSLFLTLKHSLTLTLIQSKSLVSI